MNTKYFYWYPWKASVSRMPQQEESGISAIEPNELDEVLGFQE